MLQSELVSLFLTIQNTLNLKKPKEKVHKLNSEPGNLEEN